MKITLKQLQDQAVLGLSKSRSRMHNALIATLRHIHEHGDRNALHNIVDQLKANKSDAGNLHRISVWLADMGGIKFDEDSKSPTYRSVNGWQGKEYIQANFERAKASPWYEYKKPAKVKELPVAVPFAGFDLTSEVLKVVEAAKAISNAAMAMTPEDQAKVSFTLADEAINALLELSGIEFILNHEDDAVAA